MILAGFLAELQAQIMRGGFSQQGLAATGRTIKQKALRDRMLETLE